MRCCRWIFSGECECWLLGGLIAGFLAGYVVLGLKRLFSGLPVQLEGIKPVLLYPVFGLLITGVVMQKQ